MSATAADPKERETDKGLPNREAEQVVAEQHVFRGPLFQRAGEPSGLHHGASLVDSSRNLGNIPTCVTGITYNLPVVVRRPHRILVHREANPIMWVVVSTIRHRCEQGYAARVDGIGTLYIVKVAPESNHGGNSNRV